MYASQRRALGTRLRQRIGVRVGPAHKFLQIRRLEEDLQRLDLVHQFRPGRFGRQRFEDADRAQPRERHRIGRRLRQVARELHIERRSRSEQPLAEILLAVRAGPCARSRRAPGRTASTFRHGSLPPESPLAGSQSAAAAATCGVADDVPPPNPTRPLHPITAQGVFGVYAAIAVGHLRRRAEASLHVAVKAAPVIRRAIGRNAANRHHAAEPGRVDDRQSAATGQSDCLPRRRSRPPPRRPGSPPSPTRASGCRPC